jgi:cellulose synthase/poly-beta-1,6-N-acetylglucosamine synthase-like glycosyltransferase
MPTSSVVQILTASIAPVIVISGIGLLLLSITNRYGRAIDRARLLMRELQSSDADSAHARHLEEQLRHTHQRARLLRGSMVYSSGSIFFVTLTILSLFAEQVFSLHLNFLALLFFALCMISLVISIYYSIRDITVSLAALEMEMSSVQGALRRSR